ncbi:MAG: hypothetical protein QXY83_06030 [Thermosphaera sp.]
MSRRLSPVVIQAVKLKCVTNPSRPSLGSLRPSTALAFARLRSTPLKKTERRCARPICGNWRLKPHVVRRPQRLRLHISTTMLARRPPRSYANRWTGWPVWQSRPCALCSRSPT